VNMRLVLIITALVLHALARAAERPDIQGIEQKPLKGDYLIYGGELGDTVPPTKTDRKVAFTFKGPLARDLFEQIGPDNKNTCGAAPDHRIRERGDLSCVWDKRDGYICYFGLDVPTGRSTYGSIC